MLFYTFTFDVLLETGRAKLTPCYKTKVSSTLLHLREASLSMGNYKTQSIMWITTFNAVSSITRSCYLRLTLYGCRETPFSNHFKTCNPKSIKPTDYKQSNIINHTMKDTTKKERA